MNVSRNHNLKVCEKNGFQHQLIFWLYCIVVDVFLFDPNKLEILSWSLYKFYRSYVN